MPEAPNFWPAGSIPAWDATLHRPDAVQGFLNHEARFDSWMRRHFDHPLLEEHVGRFDLLS